MQVIKREDEWLAASRQLEEPRGRVEEDEPGIRGFEGGSGRRIEANSESVSKRRNDLSDVGRPIAELAPQRFEVAASCVSTNDLHPGPEWRRAPAVPAPASENENPPSLRLGCELRDEMGFADAGLTRDEKETAVAGRRFIEAGPQLAEFSFPADEDRL